MNTPIVDFVKKYSQSDIARLHMPGHKGVSFLGCENLDITEINGADALYLADGIIRQSEENATSLFGSCATIYSAGGSSQCIKAMLFLLKQKCIGKKCKILAARNVHKSFIYACGLLDIDVEWLFDESSEYSLCRCRVSGEQLENMLRTDSFDAVYITSPDYLGGMNDIATLSDIAHRNGAFMLVDNAHGAYLRFLSESCHPVSLGADMCCDSAHKTLPVLTGGAYLHIGNCVFADNAKTALEMFGSTSPSYLILQSLDMCNAYLSEGYQARLCECVEKIRKLKEQIALKGWKICESDPLKLTICSSGVDLSERLRKHGIECEYEDPDYTVMMFTPETDSNVYDRVAAAVGNCDAVYNNSSAKLMLPEKECKISDALFAETENICIDESVGRIIADTIVGCPPAVPVLVSGEFITENAVEIMKYYSINKIKVIKMQ